MSQLTGLRSTLAIPEKLEKSKSFGLLGNQSLSLSLSLLKWGEIFRRKMFFFLRPGFLFADPTFFEICRIAPKYKNITDFLSSNLLWFSKFWVTNIIFFTLLTWFVVNLWLIRNRSGVGMDPNESEHHNISCQRL